MTLRLAMDEAVDATRQLGSAWMAVHAHAEAMTLEELVGLLASLRDALGSLQMVDADLSTSIYDRVWSEFQTHTAVVGSANVDVGRSRSTSTDGERLVGVLASRLGDEFGDAGYRVADPNGELMPPSEVVRQIVERVADIAGLRNKSQNWAKTRLAPLGVELDRFQEVERGRKTVKLK